jgi:hypothetical protein
MPSLIQVPESDDPAERARIPKWLKRQSKERRHLYSWIAMIIPLFIALPLITVLGVFLDADGCSQLIGNVIPWVCSTIPRGAIALSGFGFVMWTFMRWLVVVMRVYRYRDERDLIDPEHPDRIDPNDPETW